MSIKSYVVPVVATVAVVLAVGISGCSSNDPAPKTSDRDKAVANLTKMFVSRSGSTAPTAATKKAGSCMAAHLVDGAGVAALQADKVLTKTLATVEKFPTKLSEKSAQAYADAYVACYNIDDFKADIQAQTKAPQKKIDRYAACVKSVDSADLHQMIVDEFTTTKSSKVAKRVETKLQSCYKKLG